MIGRGTRLCKGLFGPDADKQDSRVFDFCFNFDFFRENPDGIEAGGAVPLGTRLFHARVELLAHVQAQYGAAPDLDPETALAGALTTELHREVAAMHPENFIVRMHLEAVVRFRERSAWEQLSDADREALQVEVAGLPSAIETDDIESRLFDLKVLKTQLAQVEGDLGVFENHRQRKIVYTDFQDEVMGVRDEAVIDMPTMTGILYEKRVKDYLKNHFDHIVIRRL